MVSDPGSQEKEFLERVGEANRSLEERKEIAKKYVEQAGATAAEVPPDIVELQKRQAVAGTPGHPNLTDEERQKLREYYVTRPTR